MYIYIIEREREKESIAPCPYLGGIGKGPQSSRLRRKSSMRSSVSCLAFRIYLGAGLSGLGFRIYFWSPLVFLFLTQITSFMVRVIEYGKWLTKKGTTMDTAAKGSWTSNVGVSVCWV